MKQEEVDKLFEDVREILRLEKLLSENKMTQEDATNLKSLAEKGYPRAEFDYGLFLAIEMKKIEDARVWFDKCRRHADGSLMNKLRKVCALISKRKKRLI